MSTNQRLVDHLRAQAAAALPDTSIDAAINGQTGMSPTLRALALAAVTLVVGGVLVFVLHVSVVVAAVPIAFAMFGGGLVLTLYGKGRLLAITPDEIIVLELRKGQTGSLIGRSPRHLIVVPYWDSTWLRLDLGPETIWVSKKLWGSTVTELAA